MADRIERAIQPFGSLPKLAQPSGNHRAETGAQILSPAARCLDPGGVDVAHLHHRGEGALRFLAAGGDGFGEDARGDLPGEAPASIRPMPPS